MSYLTNHLLNLARICGQSYVQYAENNININNQTLSSDDDKITYILQHISATDALEDAENFQIKRIGRPNANYNRLIKLSVSTTQISENILTNAKKLKDAPPELGKIFIKKDQHPVLITERNRLLKKKSVLQKKPENAGKDIKLIKGELLMNGEIIDRNMFFQ